MNSKPLILVCILVLFFSCKTKKSNDQAANETPEALQDQSKSLESGFSKRSMDLIESLYQEQVKKDTSLQRVEKELKIIVEASDDSTNAFEGYNAKNDNYYSSADRKLTGIQDSILRDQIKNILGKSESRYREKIAKHEELLKVIEARTLEISDLYAALKVVTTVPVIEIFQKNNLPPPQPIERFGIRQSQLAGLIDTLVKKQ